MSTSFASRYNVGLFRCYTLGLMKLIKFYDDRQRKYVFPKAPERIVSLVPSDTYSIVRLGAKGKLVGRTRYCVEPRGEVEDVEVIGGTKDVDVARVIELEPDLVIANQEENTRAQIERMDAAGLSVLVSFPKRVVEGIGHLARLAMALGLAEDPRAKGLVKRAYEMLRAAERRRGELRTVRAFVPIWMDPLMTVHAATFISDMLALVGAENVFGDRARRYPLAADRGSGAALPPERVAERDTRYPRVTLAEVVERAPLVVLLPDEPHAFSEADRSVFLGLEIPAARTGKVLFCDGKDLMWYGARSVEGIERLMTLVHG